MLPLPLLDSRKDDMQQNGHTSAGGQGAAQVLHHWQVDMAFVTHLARDANSDPQGRPDTPSEKGKAKMP